MGILARRWTARLARAWGHEHHCLTCGLAWRCFCPPERCPVQDETCETCLLEQQSAWVEQAARRLQSQEIGR